MWARPVSKEGPADAHDAGCGRSLWKKNPADAHDACVGAACAKKEAQLMLMMLGVDAACGKKGGTADAHDAGCGRGL